MANQDLVLVPDAKPLTGVKFAATDYQSFFDDLMRRLKVEYGEVYNDYATSSLGVMLMEMNAYGSSQLLWYINRIVSDLYLDTARTRAAVARLVKQIGYKMSPATAASTSFRLTFVDGTTAGFTITEGWRFPGPERKTWESISDVVVPAALAPGDTVDVPVRQGEKRSLSFTSDGSTNQVYTIDGISTENYLAEGSVETRVDGLLWDEKPFLEYAKTNQYEVGYVDAPPTVQFGDGIAGNVPPKDAEVKITFVITDGINGSIKAHAVKKSTDQLFIDDALVKFEVDNLVGAAGLDPETAEHAKKVAPFSFAARGAAITQGDYQALVDSFYDAQYGRVAKSYALNPRGQYEDLTLNALISAIQVLTAGYVDSATALEDSTNDSAQSMVVSLASVEADVEALMDVKGGLESSVGGVRSNAAGARILGGTTENDIGLVKGTLSGQSTALDDLKAYVLANVGAGSVRDAIVSQVTDLHESNEYAHGLAENSESNVGAINASLGTAVEFADAALVTITDEAPATALASLPSIAADLTVRHGELDAALVSIAAELGQLVGLAQVMDSGVQAELQDIHTHVGLVFNDDCKSNYVQVPILSLDSEGNYISPSVGLVSSLQSRLEKIKEVTQYVEVIDGSPGLVVTDLSVKVRVRDGYVIADVLSTVAARVRDVMKRRDFGQALWLSELYDRVKESSVGVEHSNSSVTGMVVGDGSRLSLDADGNLVPNKNQITVLGKLEVISY